jgi:hypothetical protein
MDGCSHGIPYSSRFSVEGPWQHGFERLAFERANYRQRYPPVRLQDHLTEWRLSLTFSSFHAVYFPAMLMALDLPLPQTLLTHAHWTVNRQKMSKSVGNVADPLAAIETHGVDVVRWYLARVGCRFRDDVGTYLPLSGYLLLHTSS